MMEISSHLVQQIPFSAATSLNHHALLNHLRGGAASALLATTAATAAVATARVGGGGDGVVVSSELPSESFLGMAMSPEGKAVVLMAVSMALHYLGYSMARPVTVALFTSVDTGYSGECIPCIHTYRVPLVMTETVQLLSTADFI
jgi:hypothetical protein